MFLKNRNNISKIKRSKVTDYAALMFVKPECICFLNKGVIAKKKDCILAMFSDTTKSIKLPFFQFGIRAINSP